MDHVAEQPSWLISAGQFGIRFLVKKPHGLKGRARSNRAGWPCGPASEPSKEQEAEARDLERLFFFHEAKIHIP